MMTSPDPSHPAPTVLVVEDEADFREVIRTHLARSGFQVVEAPDAGMAWMLARDNSIQAVIVDLRLPGIDGTSLARQLRKLLGQIPIVGFTAWPEDDRARKNPPFDVLLEKPELAPVISSLRRLLQPPPSPVAATA